MIDTTEAYKAAVVADTRRILLRAAIEIIDPDIVYSGAGSNGGAPWSKPEQIYDKEMDADAKYATLEHGRWILDGTFPLLPEDPAELTGNVGFVSSTLSGMDGTFADPPWVELQFENVSILQACSVFFPTDAGDGLPVDFIVEVRSGGTANDTTVNSGGYLDVLNGGTATSTTVTSSRRARSLPCTNTTAWAKRASRKQRPAKSWPFPAWQTSPSAAPSALPTVWSPCLSSRFPTPPSK